MPAPGRFVAHALSRNVQSGDRIHERNADWPRQFTGGEIYVHTVADLDRINANAVHVHVAFDADSMAAAVPYEPEDSVRLASAVRTARPTALSPRRRRYSYDSALRSRDRPASSGAGCRSGFAPRASIWIKPQPVYCLRGRA